MSNRLRKSSKNRVIAGVCGGLGEYFGVDATFVRLLFVLLAIFQGVGILAYIVLWIVMPRDTSEELAPRDVVRENINDLRGEAERLADHLRRGPAGETPSEGGEPVTSVTLQGEVPGNLETRTAANRQFMAGLVLLGLGVLFLADNLHIFWWFNWGRMWPVVLIIIGGFLIYERSRPRA
jgi:phage shock protein C